MNKQSSIEDRITLKEMEIQENIRKQQGYFTELSERYNLYPDRNWKGKPVVAIEDIEFIALIEVLGDAQKAFTYLEQVRAHEDALRWFKKLVGWA